jgi:signal transduction histidine kinase
MSNSCQFTILILDDEGEIYSLLPDDIKSKYKIVTLESADELFDFVDSSEFSTDTCIGLIDVDLDEDDGTDGINLIDELAKEQIFFPVIFISNDNRTSQKTRAVKAGSYAYIEKNDLPDSDSALKAALARAEGALVYRQSFQISDINEWGRRAMVLVGSLEHEVANLIQPINNHCVRINNNNEIENIKVISQSLSKSVTDLSELINATFHYIKTGLPRKANEKVDLVGVARHVSDNMNLKCSRIEFLDPNVTAVYEIDGIRLKQIIANLIDNAMKYGDKNEKIVVGIEVLERYIEIYVSDYGQPIQKKREIRKLFLPAYRGERIEEKQGQGLGLAVVKALAQMYSGDVFHRTFIDNSAHAGNTFGVRLPLDSSLPRNPSDVEGEN